MSQTDGAAARGALESLLASAPEIGALLPDDALDRLERYVALLLDANERVNLTRITDPDEVARLHLLDALAALPLLDALAPRRAVDLGSGGGVPALPLAIAGPAVKWMLVESVAKKATALRSFASELGLANVKVVAERAEILGHRPELRERFDLATARACAALPVLAELALPFLRRGGELIAWKGPLDASSPELRAGGAAARVVGGGPPRLVRPPSEALGGHTFVIVSKVAPTPPRYPRRPGEPARRPLA